MSDSFDPSPIVQKAKRWVIKVGTSVLTDERELKVSRHCVQSIASQIISLWKSKKEAVLVTSGAIGIGMGVLDLKSRPKDLAQLQAAAATGQGKLMQWYASRMEEDGYHAAQVLLTREDLEDPQRRRNVKGTLETLLKAGIVPIINENDTVSTEEIRYGDNDLLSAHVAILIGADLLVNLTDVDQLMGPEGEPLIRVDEVTLKMKQAARGTSKESSTGGARTKFEAGKMALAHKIPMVVMTGRGGRMNIVELLEGTGKGGTWFIQ